MLVEIQEHLHNSEASPKQERSKVFLEDDSRKTLFLTIIKVAGEHRIAGQCSLLVYFHVGR